MGADWTDYVASQGWGVKSRCAMMLIAAAGVLGGCRVNFPGESFSGALPQATPVQLSLKDELRGHVEYLAGTIGGRSLKEPENLFHAEHYLASKLGQYGYQVKRQMYECEDVDDAGALKVFQVSNLEVELQGTTRPEEIVVIGAHYDTVNYKSIVTPGADANASGTAGVLALARMMREYAPARTIRFVLFVNEEPPWFWTEKMGSRVYSRTAKQRGENITAMLSLEMIGFYSDTQEYPPIVGAAYPSTGDFIAFVGMSNAEPLVTLCVETFRANAEFPCEGAALPWLVPRVGSSDHWSFWVDGYAAAMVTDTATYRNKNYHKATDTPDTLDYEKMARVVSGLVPVIEALCDTEEKLVQPEMPP